MSQDAIGWLLAIYAGAVVGWVAEQLTLVRRGAVINTLAGMVAASAGNLAYSLFGPSVTAANQIVVGVASAVCILALMAKRKRHRASASWRGSGYGSARRSAAWKMYAMKK